MKNISMKELRIKKKKSRTWTAKKVGITLSYLDMIEAGTRRPSDKVKFRFAEAYGCSAVQIFLSCDTTQSCIKNLENKK